MVKSLRAERGSICSGSSFSEGLGKKGVTIVLLLKYKANFVNFCF